MIKLKNVSKAYYYDGGKTEVLKDVSLHFKKGEFVAIYGPSGSGKSTLMNLIAGLDEVDSGQIFIDNTELSSLSRNKKAKVRNKKIGFVFQKFNLIPHLKAVENVQMPANIAGENIFKSRIRAIKALTKLGLKNHVHKAVNKLSGGQKQRVAIARALMNDPDIILADEPTGALDSEASKLILDELKKISESGKLVICVTHDDSVLEYSTKVVRLDSKTVNVEEIEEVESDYTPSNKRYFFTVLNMFITAIENVVRRPFRNGLYAITAALAITMALVVAGLNYGVQRGIDNQIADLKGNSSNTFVYMPSGQRLRYDPEFMDYVIDFESLDEVRSVYVYDMNMTGFISLPDLVLHTDFSVYADGSTKEVEYGRIPESRNEVVVTQQLASSIYEGFIDSDKMDEVMNSMLGQTINVSFINSTYDDSEILSLLRTTSESDYFPQEELTIVGVLPKNAVGHRVNDKKDFIYLTNEIISDYHGMKYIVPDILMESSSDTGEVELMFNVFEGRENTLVMKVVSVDDDLDTLTSVDDYISSRENIYITENNFLKYVEVFNVLNNIVYILFGFIILSSFIVLLMFGAIQYVSIASRIKEIGIMNALGIQVRSLILMLNIEGIVLALASAFISFKITDFLILRIKTMLFYQFKDLGYYSSDATIFVKYAWATDDLKTYALIGSVIIVILASVIPSLKIARLNPIESLKEK